jgi:hypothetical protein
VRELKRNFCRIDNDIKDTEKDIDRLNRKGFGVRKIIQVALYPFCEGV